MNDEPKDKAVHRGEPFRKYAIEAILLDLIAELCEAHPIENGYCLPCTHWGAVNPWNPNESNDDDDRCPSLQTVDRAEQRLREVSGE